MEYAELTERIIGCAYKVYNKMGFGFLESVYEKCLLIELHKAGLEAESQKFIRVHYDGKIVGEFVADIIVNDAVIIELKSVRRIIEAHEVQLVVRPGKVAYFSGCESRPGRLASHRVASPWIDGSNPRD